MKKYSTLLILTFTMLIAVNTFAAPKLNSYPSAPSTIFLDFDGHYLNSSSIWCAMYGLTSINSAPSGMTDIQITEVFNRVSEDYRPFVVNITTDSTVYLAAPAAQRIRIIITPSNSWNPGLAGIAYVGSFTWGDDTPGFVFCNMLGPNNPKSVAECCSHESGHTVGLSHQSAYDPNNCAYPSQTYNPGVGSGEIGWAPIMGSSYTKNMTNWNNGPTPDGCTQVQDNLSIITSQNSFGFRPDDYLDLLNGSTYSLPSTNFNVSGIITTDTDKDAFKFVMTRNSNFHLTAMPFSIGANNNGANLDIKLELFNASGTLIRTYDPGATMSVTIDTVLLTGTYFIKIDGTGNINIGEYGSLGSYTISGTSGPLPIHSINLTGQSDKGNHNLNWTIIADEPIAKIEVESSNDGQHFTPLASVMPYDTKFSYASFTGNTLFYRLKVTSVTGQEMYSNTVAIASNASAEKKCFVSTLVHDEIVVNAPMTYQYLLNDMSGRIIATGTITKGINKINVSAWQKGMYLIQIFNDDQKQAERIIKQ